MNQELEYTEVEEIKSEDAIQKTITQTLVKANITEAVIAKLKADYSTLTINGQEDKEGYIAVQEARKDAKRIRIMAEKCCEDGRAKALKEQRLWIAKEKDVVARIAEVEDYLSKQEKEWEATRDKLKAEKKALEERQFAARLQELLKLGATFDGTFFVIGESSFEAVLVREADDDIYQSVILPPFKVAWEEKEAERILDERRTEEERQKKEQERIELERIRKEQEDERERLRLEKEDLARQQRDIDEAKEQEQRRLDALAKEKADNEIRRRCNQLMELGLKFDFSDNHYKNYNVFVPFLDIQCHSDEQWEEMISKIGKHIEEQKAHEARAEAARIENEKQTAIQRALDEQRDRQKAESERIENERLAEQQRRADEAEQATDKDKWASLLHEIRCVTIPDMKSGPYRKKIASAKELIEKIINL